MNIQEARAWVASSAAQRYLQGIDEATDDALEASARNIRSMSAFPSGSASEYRRAASTLERSQGAFNTEVNLIVQGRARDGRAVAQACRRYVADLVILEEMNTRHGAFVDARVAALAAAFAESYVRYATALRQRFAEVARELTAMNETLRQARRDIDEAVLQATINSTLTAGTALLPELGLPARVAIGSVSVVQGWLLDQALGPSGSAIFSTGTANSTVAALADLLPRTVRMAARFITAATTLVGMASDANEIEGAERIFIRLQRHFDQLRRMLPELEREFRSTLGTLETAQALFEGATRTAQRAAASYRSSEGDYRSLLRELASIR
jgi:hypothetical protein